MCFQTCTLHVLHCHTDENWWISGYVLYKSWQLELNHIWSSTYSIIVVQLFPFAYYVSQYLLFLDSGVTCGHNRTSNHTFERICGVHGSYQVTSGQMLIGFLLWYRIITPFIDNEKISCIESKIFQGPQKICPRAAFGPRAAVCRPLY